jgi:hypothetical protein
LGQTAVAVAEAREVYTLLAVEAGGKPICQVEHFASVL